MSKDISAISFDLFREWTSCARQQYPKYEISIIDESKIVNDVKKSLENAINSLQQEKNDEQRKTPGYDYKFIVGYLQGSLNQHWFHEYIRMNSDEYKGFIAIKAIYEYLKVDELTCIRLNTLYQRLLEKEINLANFDFSIKSIGFFDQKNEELQSRMEDKSEDSVSIYLENQIRSYVVKLMNIDNPIFLKDIESIIDEAFIMEIMRKKRESKS